MTRLGGWGAPGVGSLLETVEKELLWGGDQGKLIATYKSGVIDGTARDAGNSPTTILRPGLVLGVVAATGNYKEYDPDAVDGTQIAKAILPVEIRAQDFDANNADRHLAVLVAGQVKAGELIGLDRQARNQFGASMLFDDELGRHNHLGSVYANELVETDKTLVATDHGVRFVCTTADCEFTLPALATSIGFKCEILMAENFELVVASAEGDNMIVGGDASADSLTYTTTGEQIGARVWVEAIVVNTTPKWLITVLKAPFSTDDFLASSIAT